MYRGKRFLAIVPARSGSKGVPDKNIRDLSGKPLMAYTIEAALATGVIDDIVVSTDSGIYADIARKYGALVPFLRPKELSEDSSLASGYIIHTIEGMKAMGRVYDYFILLQPTSPLRTAEHIMTGIKMVVDECLSSVVAFSEAEHPPEIYHLLPADMGIGNLKFKEANRQEHGNYYRINGMLYICDCDMYLKTKNFYDSNGKALIIGKEYAIDIDTEYDFALAEFLLKKSGSRD